MTSDDHRAARLVSIAHRHVALTALRWLPTGLTLPVTVLLMQARGLTLAEIGVVAATQGGVVLLLELPTGGLADALGRRAVLIVAAALDVLSLTMLLSAHSVTAFMAAAAVQGVHRALDSGPLDAWYVDASQAVDPAADIEAGMARTSTTIGVAVAGGALATAGLTAWEPVGGLEPLVLPVLLALGLRIVYLAALSRFLTEGHRGPGGVRVGVSGRRGPAGAVRAGVAEAPRVVGRTVGLIARSRALSALTAVELTWGAGLVAVELFSAPRLVDLLGGTSRAVVAFSLAAAAAWTVSALGAAWTSRATALAGGSPARLGAWLRVLQGGAVVVVGVVAGPAAMVAGYLAFYLVHGTANAVHAGMVHRLAGPGERTTVLSAQSLAARVGGIAAGLGLGWLADGAGITWALLVAAAVLASAAPLYVMAGRHAARDTGPLAGRVRAHVG